MSIFKELSQQIRVNDIYEPFIGEFQDSDSVELAWYTFMEIDVDPFEQIALVKENKRPTGWIGFEDLDAGKYLYECYNPITGDIFISSDTTLLKAINTVFNEKNILYLVLKENNIIGFLWWHHFSKLPFRMCLFALLIDLEKEVSDLLKANPESFLKNLSDRRLKYARKIYNNRGFPLNNDNEEYGNKLIDCTGFKDKLDMLRENPNIKEKCPNIISKYTDQARDIRNSIAHPDGETTGLPISREELIPFVKWTEELQRQINEYSQQMEPIPLFKPPNSSD